MLLQKPLYQLTTDEISTVRQMADVLFVRLTSPLRQSRIVEKFDFRETLKSSMKVGQLVPAYVKQEKKHFKSKIVIAMSLSGIDRCFGVGLIPLLYQLRKHLQYRLFIYTDDLIEAEFDEEGYINNDYKIAWNNVLGPCVFARLSELELEKGEETLLLVDSFGGMDSEWYTYINKEISLEVSETQRKFIGKGTSWDWIRKRLNGNFDKFSSIPKNEFPLNWEEKIASNCKERWVDAPALKEYLIRYIFNPKFGDTVHGSYFPFYYGSGSVEDYLFALRAKFKNIHVLNPCVSEQTKNILNILMRYGVMDFNHQADSLEGFAETLVNIAYRRETNRITCPVVKFSKYSQSKKESQQKDEHSELIKSNKICFDKVPEVIFWIPKGKLNLSKRVRGTSKIEQKEVSFSELSLQSVVAGCCYGLPDWKIDPMLSDYGKMKVVENIFDCLQKYKLSYSPSSGLYIDYKKQNVWETTVNKIQFEKYRTGGLKPYVENFFSYVSDDYFENELYLRAAVWCTSGQFHPKKLAISACPSDTVDKRRGTVFHEMAHWLEHSFPAIGVFTNSILEHYTGKFNENKIVPVGDGEFARPVVGGKPQWIKMYAGKWYRRHSPELPNPNEVFSVHSEYFRSKTALLELLEHDPKMVSSIVFIFMGGPLCMIKHKQTLAHKEALKEIEEMELKIKQKIRKVDSIESVVSKEKIKEESTTVVNRRSFGI